MSEKLARRLEELDLVSVLSSSTTLVPPCRLFPVVEQERSIDLVCLTHTDAEEGSGGDGGRVEARRGGQTLPPQRQCHGVQTCPQTHRFSLHFFSALAFILHLFISCISKDIVVMLWSFPLQIRPLWTDLLAHAPSLLLLLLLLLYVIPVRAC